MRTLSLASPCLSGVPAGRGTQCKVAALSEIPKPVVGCFIAGTLVHTKDGLQPIEQIKVGDWVLSRPENPEEGTETGYKRVTKTFRFEDKPVVSLAWFQRPADDPTGEKYGGLKSTFDWVFATPNHPVWVEGHGWLAVERLHAPGKRRFGLLSLQEWEQPLMRLADGNACHISDVNDCFRTDNPNVVYTESTNDFLDWGSLWDSAESPPKYIDNGIAFDIENWVDPETDEPVVFTTTVYNIEIEDWHTYFVGRTGLWVHNTNCLEASLEMAPGKRNVIERIKGALQFGKAEKFKHLTKAKLNDVLRNTLFTVSRPWDQPTHADATLVIATHDARVASHISSKNNGQNGFQRLLLVREQLSNSEQYRAGKPQVKQAETASAAFFAAVRAPSGVGA